VIVALISPLKKIENLQDHLFKNEDFIEVFVSTPLNVCKKRDTKKLYSKSKKKKILI
jgi:adenylylsulfate kinase